MAIDVSKVLVGAPDQKTTGAILDAPLGTKLPKTVADLLDPAFKDSGFIGEDGLTMSIDRSTSGIKDWSKATVRKMLDSFENIISWVEIQMDERSLARAFGEENVKVTPATGQAGKQVYVGIGAELPEPRSWVFKMKDGKNKILIVVPHGQVTEIDEVNFAASDAIGLGIKLETSPDENGKNVYIILDDGVVSA